MTKDEWRKLKPQPGTTFYFCPPGTDRYRPTILTEVLDTGENGHMCGGKFMDVLPDSVREPYRVVPGGNYRPCEMIFTKEQMEEKCRKKSKTKKCVICGNDFHPVNGRQVTCSPKCSQEWNNRNAAHKAAHWGGWNRATASLKKRDCEVCGHPFEPKSPNQKYCSPKCSAIRQREQQNERRRRKRNGTK